MSFRAKREISQSALAEFLREIPRRFDWAGGKAGRVLPAALADKLEDIWARYIQKLHDEGSIDGERAAHMEWGDIL